MSYMLQWLRYKCKNSRYSKQTRSKAFPRFVMSCAAIENNRSHMFHVDIEKRVFTYADCIVDSLLQKRLTTLSIIVETDLPLSSNFCEDLRIPTSTCYSNKFNNILPFFYLQDSRLKMNMVHNTCIRVQMIAQTRTLLQNSDGVREYSPKGSSCPLKPFHYIIEAPQFASLDFPSVAPTPDLVKRYQNSHC